MGENQTNQLKIPHVLKKENCLKFLLDQQIKADTDINLNVA